MFDGGITGYGGSVTGASVVAGSVMTSVVISSVSGASVIGSVSGVASFAAQEQSKRHKSKANMRFIFYL